MYRNVYYEPREQLMKLFTWDDEGKRIVADCSYTPYLYLETKQETNFKSIFKTNLKKRSFKTAKDRAIFTKSCEHWKPTSIFLTNNKEFVQITTRT